MSALRSSKGYSLIELMMIVVIVGLLSSFAIPKYQGYMEKARIARSVAEIRYFEREIKAYYIEHEKYPDSLLDLGRSFNNLLDPWGNQYQYFLIAGTKWARAGGGGDRYYARSNWTSGIVTVAAGGEAGFWSGSWFVSEAWAAPGGGGGNSGGGGGNSGGGGGNSGGGGGNSGGGGGNSGGGGGNSGGGGGNSGGGGDNSGGGGGNSGGGGGNSGGGGGGNSGGGGPPPDVQKKPRQDRFLKPVTSDYDLYSMGPDGETTENLNAKKSLDDIIRASDGAYVGLAENF